MLDMKWVVVFILTLQVVSISVDTHFHLISNSVYGERHSNNYCAMYDICGETSDGKVLNCPYGSPAVKPDDLFSAKVQSLCPTISGLVCCTEAQFDTLRAQVQQAVPFLVGCPACLRNFLNLFCELSCSPRQSLFINVTSVSEVNGNLTVDGIDFFTSDTFGEGLYDSCKDVKFGTMNTRAIEFVGGGAKSFKEWLEFIGLRAEPGLPGSPYAINFQPSVPKSSEMEVMNLSTYSCGDTSLGCSCGDCPSASACSIPGPPSEPKTDSCLIRIGILKIRCIDLSLSLLYILLISAFSGWVFFHRSGERSSESSTSPLNSFDGNDINDGNLAMDEMKVSFGKFWAWLHKTNELLRGFMHARLSAPIWQTSFPFGIAPSSTGRVCLVVQREQNFRKYNNHFLRPLFEVSLPGFFIGQFWSYFRDKRAFLADISLFIFIPLMFCTGNTFNEEKPCPTLYCSASVVTIFQEIWFMGSKKSSSCSVFIRAVVLILCLGLIRFEVETRPEKLWVGPGSKAAEEKQYFDSHLSPFYRIEQLILATMPDQNDGKSPRIVTEDNIRLLFEIQNKVDQLRANYSGTFVALSDICLKPLGEDCAAQTVLQYYQMDPDSYDDLGGVEHAEYCFQHYAWAETCLSAFKGPLDPSTALGGFSGNNYYEASAFVITYPVNNAVNQVGGEIEKAVAWEKAFIHLSKDELLPMVQSRNLTLSFSSENSIEDELKRESTADIVTIVISYLVMFAYISITLGDAPHLSTVYLSSKVLLALSGVVIVVLSVLGSVGVFSAVRVKSTLIIMEVIPLLVLAVGVDNMCILVHAVKRQPLELPLEGRVGNALAEVGPSITLASLSEVVAFAVGSFISMPACRVFSMFAALAVLLDFLLQVTAFIALIALDFARAEDNRIDCFPCIRLPYSSVQVDEGRNQGSPGLVGWYMEEIHARTLGVWGVKVTVIATFVALALASIALSTRIEPGLEQQVALPRDSYLQGYFQNISEYLRIGPPLYFVVKGYNYSAESKHTNRLCSISHCDSNSLLNEISRASLTPETSYIAKPAASWLDDFLVWMSPEAFGCCRKFVNGSYCPPDDQPPCCSPDDVESCGIGGVCKDCTTCFRHTDLNNDRPSTVQFMEKLPWFLSALPSADCAKAGYGAYTTTVDLEGYETGIIKASEFRTYHTPLNKQDDYVRSMRAAREFTTRVSNQLKIHVFPYSVFYIFFEQYLDIWSTALINIGIALGAVFLVCLVITSSLWSSAIILLVLAMILVDLLGVMSVLNIQLNAVSVVNLIMSIGIAVEFCVHISHAFSVSLGDRETRAKEALRTMGSSVFSGITLTKFVGVIVLYFAKSDIFVVYYFQMYLALVILGFLHGLVFLPVILSMVGPQPRFSPVEIEESETLTSSSTN